MGEAERDWAVFYYREYLPALARAKVDLYLWQVPANWVLLVMTVVLVLSGVVLAGLQLYWSYRLGAFGESQLEVTDRALRVASPFVGLLILVVSLAFFYLFVHEIYRLRETGEGVPPAAAARPVPGTGPLPGVPPY
jgi:hypothetical protein